MFSPEYQRLLAQGTHEMYANPVLYDHEYKRRRADVRYYLRWVQSLVPPSAGPVLDLGCGTGRFLLPLVRAGYTTVGLDLSAPMLQQCAARLQRLSPRVRNRAHLVQSPFLPFPFARQFPVVLCTFHGLMHLYTHAEVSALLTQVREHLAPGGWFLFDVTLPDLSWLCKDPLGRHSKTRFRHPETGAWCTYSTNHSYDPVRQIAFIRLFYEHASSTDVVHLVQRQFFPVELEGLLADHGFHVARRHGDFDNSPLDPDSPEQIIHAQRRYSADLSR